MVSFKCSGDLITRTSAESHLLATIVEELHDKFQVPGTTARALSPVLLLLGCQLSGLSGFRPAKARRPFWTPVGLQNATPASLLSVSL